MMYQQKSTLYTTVQPTTAAASERRRASKKEIYTGSGISHVQRRAERSVDTHSNQARHSVNSTYLVLVLLCITVYNQQKQRRASDGGRAMYVHTAKYCRRIVVVRVGGHVVRRVHKTSFLIHESHPGVGLLLKYQQKCTAAVCCCVPTRAAPGEKYSSSIAVVRVGGSVVGEHNFSFFIHESHPGVVLLLMYQ